MRGHGKNAHQRDGSLLGFEDQTEVLRDHDGSVLGLAVGALLGTLEGMLLSASAGLRLGALDGSLLGSEDGAEVLEEPDGWFHTSYRSWSLAWVA
jgi:hypothetical protein